MGDNLKSVSSISFKTRKEAIQRMELYKNSESIKNYEIKKDLNGNYFISYQYIKN